MLRMRQRPIGFWQVGREQASGPIGKAILMIHETSGQFKLAAIYGGKNDEQ